MPYSQSCITFNHVFLLFKHAFFVIDTVRVVLVLVLFKLAIDNVSFLYILFKFAFFCHATRLNGAIRVFNIFLKMLILETEYLVLGDHFGGGGSIFV